MYAPSIVGSLGKVPVDDKAVIEQAARDTGFRIEINPTDDPRLIEVFSRMPYGTEHGPFWSRCQELQEASA